jgi:alcohol dehydrogenase
MKAALFHAFGQPLELADVPDPVAPLDGVVIRVEANGICRSDWHAWMGHDPTIELPHVPGHELAGTIVDTGKETRNWRVGDRVTLPFCCGCGRCEQCRAGHQHICDNDFQPGFTAWGSFAQYVAVPHADVNLVRLPDELGFVEAASLGCRFMTAFGAVVDKARVSPGEWVVVHGCGGVGLSVVMIAAALDARVIGVDIDDDKLELARAVGASETIDARRQDPVAAVHELTLGGAQVSIDALGSRQTCQNSIQSLAKRGRHVQVGLMLADDRHPEIPMAEVIAKELQILGSHGMQAHRYEAMLQMITSGKLRPGMLIQRTVALEEAGSELAAMGRFSKRGVTVIDRF